MRLLIEGPDDKHVISHLLRTRNAAYDQVTISDHGGIDLLLEELSVFLKGSEDFGVVIDANDSIQSRWDAVRNRAMNAGYSVPAQPDTEGTVVTGEGKPRFGVWIMPDNRVPGRLEDFVRHLVPQDDDLWPVADDAVRRLPEEQRRFNASALLKAVLHTWLAWQKRPGTPMGAAINHRYLRADSALADRFISWVARLHNA